MKIRWLTNVNIATQHEIRAYATDNEITLSEAKNILQQKEKVLQYWDDELETPAWVDVPHETGYW